MPDGKLGKRIRDWWIDLWDRLGLDTLMAREKERLDEWRAVDSLWALRQYAKKYPGIPPHVMVQKAKELGASDHDMMTIAYPESTIKLDNPSVWVSQKLQQAFSSPAWGELSETFGAVIFDPWLASLTGGRLSPGSPELENVRRFLGTQVTFEALGSIISSLGEIGTAGQVEDLGRIFTDAKWLLGTCFTSWQSTSPVVESVILKPLQRLINYTFRETDFTRSQWMDLLALGRIDSGRLGAELARLGYSNEKIGWLVALAEKQPSRGDLLAMWNKGIVTDTIFADGLRRLGYNTVWIDRFMRLYRLSEAQEEKGVYLSTLRKAFKEQLISETQLREELERQGRSEMAIDLEVAVLKLSEEVALKTAQKSDIRSAYMDDIIGRPEAKKWLTDAGFASHTIDLLLSTWDKQREPTYRKINKSEVLQAWGAGVLSRPEAYQRLLELGYDENGATVLMDTYARTHLAAKLPSGYRLGPQDIMWAWHTQVITKAEALAKLVDIGLSEEDAGIFFETFRRLHPRVVATLPKELQKDDILEAWGRNVITRGNALKRLTDIGYTEQDAGLLVESYALRPEALPPEPTISQLLGATRRGVITTAVLSQKLTALGVRRADVQFYVAYAMAPLPLETKRLSRRDITTLWKLGRHDRAWALERLLALKYSPEDAADILYMEAPQIEDTETYILWKAKLITDDIARAMWLTMGFSEEDVQRVLKGG